VNAALDARAWCVPAPAAIRSDFKRQVDPGRPLNMA
jgi:hypothetical protein